MKKLVINRCYGGFGLSEKAVMRYVELKGIKVYVETDEGLFTNYYLCEPEEYKKIETECRETRNFDRLAALHFDSLGIERDDPSLIQVVEELCEEADGEYAELKVVWIPDDVEYEIENYDGIESIHEKHRVWW